MNKLDQRDADAATDKAVQTFLLVAHELAKDGTLDSADLDLLKKLAVTEHLFSRMDPDTFARAQEDGYADRYTLQDEERPLAEHASRRVAAIHLGKLVADGNMPAKDARELLATLLEWPEHDPDSEDGPPSDEDVIAQLADLASGKDHARMRGVNDKRAHPDDQAAMDQWLAEYYPASGKSKGVAPAGVRGTLR